jgi:hypothetical protein
MITEISIGTESGDNRVECFSINSLDYRMHDRGERKDQGARGIDDGRGANMLGCQHCALARELKPTDQ